MIICKWLVTRGDGTEGGEEGEGEGGEREEEKKYLRTERDGPTEGSTRGPRESKNWLFFGSCEESF